ncbi:MAG: hypothetical protein JXB42_02700 [Deltaproteobacteria bacterium]|nr:hypothetical protein [Deltaproteobacteria bacterium]
MSVSWSRAADVALKESFEKSPLLQYRHAELDPASSIFRYFVDSGSRFACPE